MILFPQKRPMYVPIIKKGPKGTSLFKPFFFNIINITPIIAPIRKEKNKATNTKGDPKKRPIKKASLTSPKPIQRPPDKAKIARKNKVAKIAAKIELLTKN